MTDSSDLSALLDATRQGNETAFHRFYDATKSRVFNTALSYVRNREDAEEITQDVFLTVFRSGDAFRGDASVTTWLYRITVNAALDFLKHKKRQKRFAFLTTLFDTHTGAVLHEPVDPMHPGVVLENQEQAAILFRAIDTLPDKQKTAYILTRIEGLPQSEVAAVMASSVGAVESLLQRANENLKKQLADWYQSNRP